jgi:hypothetical protein
MFSFEMLFYNRTIHEIEKFSLKEKIGGYLLDSFLHVTKKKEPLFFGEAGKRKYLCMLYISLLPEFIHKKNNITNGICTFKQETIAIRYDELCRHPFRQLLLCGQNRLHPTDRTVGPVFLLHPSPAIWQKSDLEHAATLL